MVLEVFGGVQGGVGQVQGNGVFVGGVGEDDGGRWGSERGHLCGDVCFDVEMLRSMLCCSLSVGLRCWEEVFGWMGQWFECCVSALNSVWACATWQPFVFFCFFVVDRASSRVFKLVEEI